MAGTTRDVIRGELFFVDATEMQHRGLAHPTRHREVSGQMIAELALTNTRPSSDFGKELLNQITGLPLPQRPRLT